MLRELSRNLLHNAIFHTPPGGALSVHLRCDADQASMLISDSGPGIPAELRQRLFQPFSSGELRSGSGLGLTISHEIVQALGGSINLVNRESPSGIHGLDCSVELPVDRVCR
jgi:two-component system sensor histidine kinase TctE